MNIFKTLLAFSDGDDGALYRVDTIEHEGKMWLVPSWLDNPVAGHRIPERLILLDVLPHQKTPDGPADFVLSPGIPKSVFDGEVLPQPGDGFVVIEVPEDIQFPAFGG